MHWKTCQCRLASLHGNCCRCDEPETLLPVGEEQFVLGFGIVSDQISLRGDVFHSKRAKCDLSVYHCDALNRLMMAETLHPSLE